MRILRSTAVVLATAATGAVTACTIEFEETVHGSGVPASEIRAVSGFEGLVVDDSLNLSVEVGTTSFLVTIHADDNLLTYVTTEVDDGRLILSVQRGYRLDPMPRIEVRLPTLGSLTYAGSGSVQLEGVAGDLLQLTLAGSGVLEARGEVVDLEVRLMGSGDLDLFDLLADRVRIDATGSGDVWLFAREKLDVRRIGSGDVVYRGSPVLSEKTIGSRDVRQAKSQE